MKPVTPKYKFTGSTAWGAVSTTERQAFEVEESDVGKNHDHYLGFNHRTYTFTRADVGRKIERIYHNQPSWCFCTDEWIAQHVNPTTTHLPQKE